MATTLTKREAVAFTGLEEKTFENFFRVAGEFPCLDRNGGRGRFAFDKNVLQQWKDNFKWRTVELTKEDYALCLDFALAQHFRGYVLSDWGSARQREFGQKITNWVKGQLGEVAVQKFLKNEFNFEVELDFDIHDEIVPQDIIGVTEKGKKRTPKVGVGIKSSKPKSSFLILSENETVLVKRSSEIYILCRPDIADDHFLRITRDKIIDIVKNKPHFASYKTKIPDFTNIPCEIAGWCHVSDLERKEAKDIPGLENATGFRYVIKSGLLRKTKEDWQELTRKL